MRGRRARGSPTSPVRPASAGAGGDGARPTGVVVHVEDLTIGVSLADGVLVLRLDGGLDRLSRPLLLRVAQRGVRTGRGQVVLDCAGLASCDDCGLDALGLLPQLPGVRSVTLRHIEAELEERLEAAGLAPRLGLRDRTAAPAT